MRLDQSKTQYEVAFTSLREEQSVLKTRKLFLSIQTSTNIGQQVNKEFEKTSWSISYGEIALVTY